MARTLGLKMLRRLARHKATAEEIAQIVRDDPAMALTFGVDQLSDAQIVACATRVPATAIIFVWYRLSGQMREKCVRRAPAMALRVVPHELTREQFFACKKRAPRAAQETLAQYYEAELRLNRNLD